MQDVLGDRLHGAGRGRLVCRRVGAFRLEPQLERQVRAFVWARESGLAAGRLVLAGGEETPETEALARQLAQAYACVEYVSCSECYEDSG